MRPSSLAAVSLASALLGAGAALGFGEGAGWLGGTTKTVVGEPGTTTAGANLPPRVAPLLGRNFDPAGIYARRSAGVVTIFASFSTGEESQGSGFVVSEDGYLLTSSHVITDAGQRPAGETPARASTVFVEFGDRDRVPARIVGVDVFDDVGLLRVSPQDHVLQPVPLGDSSAVRVGEPVAAIGSPFGNANSLAVGVVSAVRRSIDSLTSAYDLPDAIQVDAPINHGNSGGPLFDGHGFVIGIAAQIRSDSGAAEGVGFAVPIDAARRSMRQLIATGKVAYAYVGIVTEDLTPTISRHFGLGVDHGALVDDVRPGTPGAHAGLRGATRSAELNGARVRLGGDVIVAIDGRPVGGSEDVLRIVSERLRPGRTATFSVVRRGRRMSVRVPLAERPANPSAG
jgi:2-alkenal reductase